MSGVDTDVTGIVNFDSFRAYRRLVSIAEPNSSMPSCATIASISITF
jgi:hypothetical protein